MNIPEEVGGDETGSSDGGLDIGLSSAGKKGKRQEYVGMP